MVKGIGIGLGRAPQGARGLKFKEVKKVWRVTSRAPQGARGLKLVLLVLVVRPLGVAPRKGRVD